MTQKEAFNAAAKLLISLPVDTLVFRKHYQKLSSEQKEELARYIQERFTKWPLIYDIGRYQIKASEFTSDYYKRGPYRPAVYQLFGGLMAVALEI